MAVAGAPFARAADPGCDDPGGIGGTGIAVAQTAPEAPGPTPSAPRPPEPAGGIGGTGIRAGLPDGARVALIGTIARFGSLCVNGTRVAYDLDVPTELHGLPGSARDLRAGHLVRVDAQIDADRVLARHIRVLDAVTGPVTARDEPRGTFRVMGLPVRLDGGAHIGLSGPSVPEVGTPVRVAGLLSPAGELIASRIERAFADDLAQVLARVTELDGRVAEVGATRVEFGADVPADALQLGAEVLLRGRWHDDALRVQSAEAEPRLQRTTFDARVSLEGFLHECTNAPGVGMDGVALALDIEQLPPGWVGRRAVATGRAGRDGRFEVERVALHPAPPEPAAAPLLAKCERRMR
ncbi:MAG: DUF5666 domain-containing protein [Burkholderiales bacterium]|nr:DUF5666 domain-containing protein [Burkholderiales bacterium]